MIEWQRADRPRRRVGRGVEAHATIGSTNDRARALLDEAGGEGRAVVAEAQTDGRGRHGRRWLSPPGTNLMVSVAIRPHLAAARAWWLSAAAAIAVRSASAGVAPSVRLEVKWPNDLVTPQGAKVGGLLLETTIDGHDLGSVVIGVGINVNWLRADMPAELRGRATSLAELKGAPIDRPKLLGTLLDELDREVIAVEAGTSPLARYRQACVTLGTAVVSETADGRVAGLAVAIDDAGGLVLDTGTGPITLTSGEIGRLRARVPA